MEGRIELVVASGKGGTGKSTFTSSLAVIAGRRGLPLVAADADAEAPNLHILLGVGEWDEEEPYTEGRIAYIREDLCTQCGVCAEVCPLGAVELVDGRYRINPFICEGCITCSINCPERAIRYKFRVRAGTIRVRRSTSYGFPLVSGEIVPGRPNSGKLVTEVKNRAHRLLEGDGLVLVDAAAGVGCQVISSLTGAHLAVLVAEPTPAGLSDLQRIHRLTKHFLIAPMLVVNKYDISSEMLEEILAYARRENIPLMGLIPYDPAVPRSMARGRPVVEEYPDSPAARAIREAAERVISEAVLDWRGFRRKYRPRRPEPYIPRIIRPDTG